MAPKARKSKSSLPLNSIAAFASQLGDWVHVCHGVQVKVQPGERIFTNVRKQKASWLRRVLHLRRGGIFPNVRSLKNPRQAYKDYLYILLNMRWTMVFLILGTVFFGLIFIFGLLLNYCNKDLTMADGFNLSFQTFTTIGYGLLAPEKRCGNYVITAEALMSMLIISMISGLIFAKFTKPKAQVAFSGVCVIQPYGRSRHALVIRVANATSSKDVRHDVIMDASFRVNLLRIERMCMSSGTSPSANLRNTADPNVDARHVLCNYNLPLVQSNFITFRMGAALVHIIDEQSPFYGLNHEDIMQSDMVLDLSVAGVESTLQDTITATCVYTADQVLWGKKFVEMLEFDVHENCVVMDFEKLSSTEDCEMPSTPKAPVIRYQTQRSFMEGLRSPHATSGAASPLPQQIRIELLQQMSSTSTATMANTPPISGEEPSRFTFTDEEVVRMGNTNEAQEKSTDEAQAEEDEWETLAVRGRRNHKIWRHPSFESSFSFAMEPLFEPLLHHPVGNQREPARRNPSSLSMDDRREPRDLISPRQMNQIQGKLVGACSDEECGDCNDMDDDDDGGIVEHDLDYLPGTKYRRTSSVAAITHSPNFAFRSRRASSQSVPEEQSLPRFRRIIPKNMNSKWSFLSLYYFALRSNWMPIHSGFILVFLIIHIFFGALYYLDSTGITGYEDFNVTKFEQNVFLSVHTLSTIGYGTLSPSPDSGFANFLVAVEGTIGLILTTLFTGVAWSKFARPRAHILFSKQILITHVYGHRCVVFRASNTRHYGEIRESSFRIGVLLTNRKTGLRQVHNVPLIAAEWPSFLLTATLIHVIDAKSPFAHIKTMEDISRYQVGVIALFSGLDTTFAETIYARKMYFWDDFLVDCHFQDNLTLDPEKLVIDYEAFNAVYEPTTIPL